MFNLVLEDAIEVGDPKQLNMILINQVIDATLESYKPIEVESHPDKAYPFDEVRYRHVSVLTRVVTADVKANLLNKMFEMLRVMYQGL